MRTITFAALVAASVSAFVACGDTASPPLGPPVGPPPPAPIPTTPVVPAKFGLDARPANPTCVAPPRPPLPSAVNVQRAFGTIRFNAPVDMRPMPGDPTRLFVAELYGTIFAFPPSAVDNSTAKEFLKIPPAEVKVGGEAGLLGFAFHPRFQQNREAFISYTAPSTVAAGGLRSVIARVKSLDNGVTLSWSTKEELLTLDQPYANHNGGGIGFGPDGFLYFGFGDGGSGGDPQNFGQNMNSLLGKFIRLDVDRTSNGKRYAIPPTNPFVNGGGAPEIYATGLRNPWRWSFDTESGDLWAGDVGQTAWEEIDRIQLGGNYGWKVREGKHCYNAVTCDSRGMIDPVVEHNRDEAKSITGGYVYHGSIAPALAGKYVYGDYVTGNVWTIDEDGANATSRLLANVGGQQLSAFGQDSAGEVYLLKITEGSISRFVPAGPPAVDTFPRKLSQTGCVDPADPKRPAAGLIAYQPGSPFWADGADKSRFIALPDGQKPTLQADGDLEFPIGSVAVKSFSFAGKLHETRLFMRHPDGSYAGYSYEWNDAQTEATLLGSGKQKVLANGVAWNYPSRSQCMNCHTAAAGFMLGLEVGQLNSEYVYPTTNRRSNQLTTWSHIGLLPIGEDADVSKLTRFADPYGSEGTAEQRARSYLHTNCSSCHRPRGGAQGSMDYRFSTAFADTKICNGVLESGDGGLAGSRVLVPGKPELSMLLVRSRALDVKRMPPIGSRVVDTPGMALLEQWIRGVQSCP